MKWLVVASMLACWLCAPVARAQASGSFQLEYAAAADCPSASAFAARIQDHTPLARQAGAHEAARRFRAVFDTSGRSTTGRLEIIEVDGRLSVRMVEGRDCPEVADALALVAAIVIDPNARRAVPAPARPAAAAPPAVTPTRTTVAPATLTSAGQPASEGRASRSAPVGAEDFRLRLELIFQAGLVTEQLVPELDVAVLYGFEVLVERDGISHRRCAFPATGSRATFPRATVGRDSSGLPPDWGLAHCAGPQEA